MKKIIAFLCSIAVCFVVICNSLATYQKEVNKDYYDRVGDLLSQDKFKSIALQKAAIKNGQNLLMFGSSEFEVSAQYSTHPSNFFKGKRDGFQVFLNGKAGYKCIVHAVDFAALGRSLKGQKVVFVLSPQWFTENGIAENTFEASTSELQVYAALFNSSISRNIKMRLAQRIVDISDKKPNKDFEIMRDYCKLYSKNDLFHRSLTFLATPYYWMRYELLSLKDELNSNKLLSKNKDKSKPQPKHEVRKRTTFDWSTELKNAENIAKQKSTNPFGMDDESYKKIMNNDPDKVKIAALRAPSYMSSEYDDFKLLLDICKADGIKPLILNIPVNGKWYDYNGSSKEQRQAYYKKIDKIVKQYGFKVADFSKYEDEKYFLKDGSHLGWKGWVYVDEAIDKYYHESKK